MIHETMRYRVPAGCLEACRQAIRELVTYVKEREPETLAYTVLEDAGDREARFLHLAVFEDRVARDRHHESEQRRFFIDLIYPATLDGVEESCHRVVERLPSRPVRVPR